MLLPAWIVQKALLLTIFAVTGMGAHRLVGGGWAGWFAGLIYVLNPFPYTRLLNGQYYVLLGYTVLPWVILAALRLREQQNWLRFLQLLFLCTLLSIVSIHTLAIAALPLGAILFTKQNLWPWSGMLALCFAFLSFYWLIPFLLGHGNLAASVSGFSAVDFNAYLSSAAPQANAFVNVASLHGFWADTSGRYATGQTSLLIWLLPLLFLLVLCFLGLLVTRNLLLTRVIALSAVVALVLAVGEGYPPLAPITAWLYAHVPIYRGFREPQKWAMLLALAYAYLGGQGILALRQRFPDWTPAIAAAFLLPVCTAPYMLWGAAGQLRSTDYPADWYAARQTVGRDTTATTLFLPWHQYLNLSFAGRVVANPAPLFFDLNPVLAGDNVEIGRTYSTSNRPESLIIQDQLLAKRGSIRTAGEVLKPLGIKYIILAKEADYGQYAWLDRQTDLTRISDSQTLTIYRNDR